MMFQYSPAPIGRALDVPVIDELWDALFQYSPAPIGRALVELSHKRQTYAVSILARPDRTGAR